MTDLFEEPDDATPLTPDERQGLIPSDITYRRELNKAEQENIARAQDWALSRRRELLTEKFIKDLHKRMLGEVWRWAGDFRTTERNIGIPYYQIPMALHELLDDVGKRTHPGYPAIGRLKGLAEIRGVMTAVASLRNLPL